MPAVRLVATHLAALASGTVGVWWRLLSQLLTIYLLGWLGAALALRVAGVAGDVSPWLALGIFATSSLSELVAIVLILRLAGHELGIRQRIPAAEAVADDRDASISRLLAITLLGRSWPVRRLRVGCRGGDGAAERAGRPVRDRDGPADRAGRANRNVCPGR